MKCPTIIASLLVSFVAAAPPSTRHFYTTDPSGEYAPSLGFSQRIITGYGLRENLPGTVPLYRCRYGSDTTFLTTDGNCEGSGFTREGIVMFIYSSQVPGSVPLNRYLNNNGDHLYWGPVSGGMGCDTGYYAQEGTSGYFFQSPDGVAGSPAAMYGFRKGCNNARDPCCN